MNSGRCRFFQRLVMRKLRKWNSVMTENNFQYNNTMTFKFLFRLILVGDQSVGKSSALLRFTDSAFSQDCEATVGVEFASKDVEIGEVPVRLQIWDTAGQETFRSITRAYYRGTAAAVLFYDVCSRRSFLNLSRWLEEARNFSTCEHMVIAVVGNKIDLHNRQVLPEEGLRMATQQGLLFFECSAKWGKGVDEIFLGVAERILLKVEKGEIDPQDESGGVKLGNPAVGGSVSGKKRCC